MRDLQNQTNVNPPTADYPNGQIRDDDGSGNGTPVDEAIYGDANQFLQKLARDAGITPNDLPDNTTNGFQLNEALSRLPGRFGLAYNGHFDYPNGDFQVLTATEQLSSIYSDESGVYYGNVNNGIAFFMVRAPHGNGFSDSYSPFSTGAPITAICSDLNYYYYSIDGVEINARLKSNDTNVPARTFPIAYNVVAMEEQGGKLYVADVTNNEVKVYNSTTGALITSLAAGTANIIDISVSGNKLYIAVDLSTNILVYDTENGALVDTFSIGGISAKSVSVYGNTINVLAGGQMLSFSKETHGEDFSRKETFYSASSWFKVAAGGNYLFVHDNAANDTIREFPQVMDRL